MPKARMHSSGSPGSQPGGRVSSLGRPRETLGTAAPFWSDGGGRGPGGGALRRSVQAGTAGQTLHGVAGLVQREPQRHTGVWGELVPSGAEAAE